MAYIKRADALEVCSEHSEWFNAEKDYCCSSTADSIYQDICNLPTADVVEVKHGEWILHPDGSGTCKICNTHQKDIWDMDNWQNFCGHCGAKMGGKE